MRGCSLAHEAGGEPYDTRDVAYVSESDTSHARLISTVVATVDNQPAQGGIVTAAKVYNQPVTNHKYCFGIDINVKRSLYFRTEWYLELQNTTHNSFFRSAPFPPSPRPGYYMRPGTATAVTARGWNYLTGYCHKFELRYQTGHREILELPKPVTSPQSTSPASQYRQ